MFKQMPRKFMLSLLLTVVVISMFPVRAFADKKSSNNLLKNPSFEEYTESNTVKLPKYWVNENGFWGLDKDDTPGYRAVEGQYFVWPLVRNNIKTNEDEEKYKQATLYQDVDVSGYNTGTVFMLSGSIASYGNQTEMRLNFLDAYGNVLSSKSVATRDLSWIRSSMILPKPEKAVTARISLIGHWHPGNQNNAYCDDFYFKVTDSKYRKVTISGKSDVKAGETVNLVANNGISQKPKDFTWISECGREAGVDDKGKVTLYSKYNPEVGVIIYARDSAGNVGSFFFGDGMENTDIEPDVISGQNNPGTEGKQTTNSNTTVISKSNEVKTISGFKVRQKGTTVYMDWKKCKGADYYLLHKYDFNKKKWEAVGFLTKDNIRGKITGLKKNKEYWYMVTAEKRTSTGSKTIAKTKIVKVKIK